MIRSSMMDQVIPTAKLLAFPSLAALIVALATHFLGGNIILAFILGGIAGAIVFVLQIVGVIAVIKREFPKRQE